MKKFVFSILLMLFFIPIYVNAASISTKIIGNEKIKPGENIVFTVIVDQLLTEYDCEITYDRNILNLVSVDEVNINTTQKEFNVEKGNPIKLNIKSTNKGNMIYSLTFNVKNSAKADFTEIGLKTNLAKLDDEVYTSNEVYNKLTIVDNDYLFEEADTTEESEVNKILADVKVILRDYNNLIIFISVSFNLILIFALVSSLRRKKVDYDF
ncbi:MAG: hypothetical protein PUD59_02995 [bacterium]|nr:hypothetical protein [bacterium]